MADLGIRHVDEHAPRAGEMNPSEALLDPEEPASVEMLSVLHTKFSTRLNMDLVLGPSYEQLYCLVDDKFGHNDETGDASSESESEGGAPEVPKPAGEGGGVLDPASDPGPREKKSGWQRKSRKYWIPPDRDQITKKNAFTITGGDSGNGVHKPSRKWHRVTVNLSYEMKCAGHHNFLVIMVKGGDALEYLAFIRGTIERFRVDPIMGPILNNNGNSLEKHGNKHIERAWLDVFCLLDQFPYRAIISSHSCWHHSTTTMANNMEAINALARIFSIPNLTDQNTIASS